MSEFARKELQKYGWTEGKGLGREENGISVPIKARYKFDTHGVGHDSSKEYTSAWWNYAFNEAANSITVVNDKDGVRVKTKKRKKKKKQTKQELSNYGGFIKAATLGSDGTMVDSREDAQDESEVDSIIGVRLTDEELFASCGGRTAHKGARFGLTMNGKLKRILEQEIDFVDRNKDSVPQNLNQQRKKCCI